MTVTQSFNAELAFLRKQIELRLTSSLHLPIFLKVQLHWQQCYGFEGCYASSKSKKKSHKQWQTLRTLRLVNISENCQKKFSKHSLHAITKRNVLTQWRQISMIEPFVKAVKKAFSIFSNFLLLPTLVIFLDYICIKLHHFFI